MRIRLRTKLLVYSGALALIPLGVAGWEMIRIIQDELKSSANNEISNTAGKLSEEIDNLYANTWLAPLQLVASGVDNQQLGIDEKISLLRASIENVADVVACQLTAAGVAEPVLIRKETFSDRLTEAQLNPIEVLRVDAESLAALQQQHPGEPVAGQVTHVAATGDWLLTVVVPLRNLFSGRALTFSARINLDRVHTLISDHPFAKRGEITLIDGQGHRLFDADRTDLSDRSIVDDAVRLLSTGSRAIGTTLYARPTGERMLAAYAFPHSFDWSVIVELDEAYAYAAIAKMRESLITWVLIGLAAGAICGIIYARSISKPVEGIARTARKVGHGDLDVEVPKVRSRDEIADLASQMQEMIKGLRDRDFIRDTFGRYVSPEVAQQVLSDPSALHPGGEVRTVTIMFSDLRGFTSLSEQLSPAEMVQLLNSYLGRMSDIIAKHGGTVIEFIGDAIMALFGAPTLHEDDPLHAVACATEMHLELESFNAEYAERGIPALQQGVGINTGSVIVGNIGSEKRMKYGVVGDDVNLAARTESFTVGGEVLVSEATRNAVGERAEFRGPIEVKAKGKKATLRLYAVVSVGPPYDLDVPSEHRDRAELREVSVPVDCCKVVGKQVSDTTMSGTIVRLGEQHAQLEIGEEIKVFENLKLRLLPGDEPIEDVYAKVQQVEGEGGTCRCHLRFTSMPQQQRARIKELASS